MLWTFISNGYMLCNMGELYSKLQLEPNDLEEDFEVMIQDCRGHCIKYEGLEPVIVEPKRISDK